MSLPQRGEMEIELGGEKRQWVLKWRAIGEIENALRQIEGKAVGWGAFRSRAQEWTIHDWALILWAGLHQVDKGITIDFVMDTATHDVFVEFQWKFLTLGEEHLPDDLKKKLAQPAEAQLN